MSKELTNSQIDRQNILNNPMATQAIQEYIGITGMLFEGEYRFTKAMVAEFYDVDIRTIERYIEKYADELKRNGYVVFRGQKLKEFKKAFGHILKSQKNHDTDINAAIKSNKLGIFSFRAFLNLGMLLTESEKAKEVRNRILDIVLDTIRQKTGGSTKYINQRDDAFLDAIIAEPQYRKEFTSALSQCLKMGNYKYAVYTDKIYKAIFCENARNTRKYCRWKYGKTQGHHVLRSSTINCIYGERAGRRNPQEVRRARPGTTPPGAG